MAKSKRKPNRPHAGRPISRSPSNAPGDRHRHWLLAATAATLVARPLLPSVSVAWRGDGLAFVVIWLILATLWAIRASLVPRARFRFAAPDAALLLFLILHSLSALVAMRDEAAGMAVNMLWEWVGMGIAYFLIRQLVNSGREARALVALSIALAVSLSMSAFEQYFISMPAAREYYYEDPDAALREIGMWSPPDSRERMLYEQRLESSEPTATFALANSLAGYLTPWLVLLGGMAATSFVSSLLKKSGATAGLPSSVFRANRGTAGQASSGTRFAYTGLFQQAVSRGLPRRAKLALAILAVPIAGCLLITKSRTAYVAVAIGCVLGWLLMRGGRARVGWKLPTAIVGTIVGLVVVAAIAGGLDREVLSEAPKSLAYRAQYWQGALSIAREFPWFGCGPGNFGDHYTRFKAATASEEVTDPHNFVFELWSTAGTPAVLALLAVLGSFAWIVCRQLIQVSEPVETKPPNSATDTDGSRFVIAGGLGGFLLAMVLPLVVGPLVQVPLSLITFTGGFVVAAVSMALLYPWIRDGKLSLSVIAAAVASLVVHLLGAGGIGFPGVALSLWLLIALGVTACEEGRGTIVVRRGFTALMAVVVLVMFVTCYFGACRPAALREIHLAMAQQDPSRRSDHLHAAAEADRRSEEPWNRLAHLHFERWQRGPNSADLSGMDDSIQNMLDLRPRSSRLWMQAGDLYINIENRLRSTETPHKDDYLERAIKAYERAVELYPNRALGRAKLALALWAAGDHLAARRASEAAIELDRVTPHIDLKLDPELRSELLRRTPRPN